MLDLVCTNSPDAYKATPRPHLGRYDHLSVMLVPDYKPLLKHSRPVKKQIRTWPEGAESALQDCFMHTDWEIFKTAASQGGQIDIEEDAEVVTTYIAKCTEDVTVIKTLTACGNRKPCMTALSKGIKAVKGTYAEKIQ